MNIVYPLILDGGLSNELEKAGHQLNHRMWTARLLESNPEAIIQVHLSYLEAGAHCITTSGYQASIPGFMEMGHSLAFAKELILLPVQLAEEAVNRFMHSTSQKFRPLIAASIGPYGAYLANGSEYLGYENVPDQTLREFHFSRIELLDSSGADFLACETIPGFREMKVIAVILDEVQTPSWISFSCKDEKHISDGTPISECAAYLAEHKNVFAIGINCTAPRHISSLLKSMKPHIGTKKIAVYPNSGASYDPVSKKWAETTDPNFFNEMAKEWINQGADIIGGCCRIGPEQIRMIGVNLE